MFDSTGHTRKKKQQLIPTFNGRRVAPRPATREANDDALLQRGVVIRQTSRDYRLDRLEFVARRDRTPWVPSRPPSHAPSRPPFHAHSLPPFHAPSLLRIAGRGSCSASARERETAAVSPCRPAAGRPQVSHRSATGRPKASCKISGMDGEGISSRWARSRPAGFGGRKRKKFHRNFFYYRELPDAVLFSRNIKHQICPLQWSSIIRYVSLQKSA